MFDDVFDSVDDTRASKYLDKLTRDERALVDEFVDYLVREHNFKLASARSYRSNFARATYKSRNNEKLNSDERSAVRKFATFMKSLA